MYRGAPDVVRALDVPIGHVGEVHGRRLVPALLRQAVVLVDEDAVPHVFHLDVLEENAGDGPRPALPRLDPQPVVGVLYEGVSNSYVRDARSGVVHAQAPNAAFKKISNKSLLVTCGLLAKLARLDPNQYIIGPYYTWPNGPENGLGQFCHT